MEQAMERTILLDENGRILIPAALKQRLGLLPGMHLVVEPGEEESVCLRVESNLPQLVDKGGVLVVASQTSADEQSDALMSDWTDITRRERDRRVSVWSSEWTHENSA
jgi:bifunctional DNA-binding transcriptional regulator/antitoxin component of YhaV-PrlF toxin-antitoxin module